MNYNYSHVRYKMIIMVTMIGLLTDDIHSLYHEPV